MDGMITNHYPSIAHLQDSETDLPGIDREENLVLGRQKLRSMVAHRTPLEDIKVLKDICITYY